MLAIKNNVMAVNAARYLGLSYDALAKSVERLSSGLRINSAKDDAAGLAVRELMRADIAVLGQGARNAQDGVSLLQTMEGAMGTMDTCLVRMKQLGEQAATGSYSSAQRVIMNAEFAEMAAEVERIATSTKFNDITMLNNTNTVSIQFGTSTDAISVSGADMTKSGLGIETGTGLLSAATNETGYATTDEEVLTVGTADLVIDIAFTDAEDTDQEVIQVTLASAVGSYSLQDIADAINLVSNDPDQMYDENGRFLGYSAASIVAAGENNYKLKISARDTDIEGMTITEAGDGTAVITGIFGAVATSGYDLMTDVAFDTFQKWDADTSDWIVDTTGTADVGINILDTTAANTALTAVTSAITSKDAARAAFGYKMNRLESSVSVLNIQAENLKTSESRISDVDVATEMAELTRNQVLAQAGTAMLAQANAIPQMALTLLR